MVKSTFSYIPTALERKKPQFDTCDEQRQHGTSINESATFNNSFMLRELTELQGRWTQGQGAIPRPDFDQKNSSYV